MKWIALLLSLCTFATAVRAGGWVGDTSGISYVEDSHDGNSGSLKSFDEVLEETAKANRLHVLEERGIGGMWLLDENAFQDELFAALRQDAPQQLQEALKSSGNMHNPKMYALWEPFQKAVLNTPTVMKLNVSLRAYGLRISDVAVPEKFELRKTDDGRRFFWGMGLQLKVSKVGGQASSSGSGKKP